MRIVGDPTRFALGFELRPDPDSAGSPTLRASWSALQLWIGGQNLTLASVPGHSFVDAAEVPLSPLLQWVVEQWIPLFHEQRLPRPSSQGSAASWRMDCLISLPTEEDELDRLLDDRDSWWQRHGFGSALPDYRIPDLHIRRLGHQVELSWDDREWRTVSGGMQLSERRGVAQIPAMETATVLWDWASAVATELQDMPDATDFAHGILKALDDIANLGQISQAQRTVLLDAF